jgi:hypothetical protein
VTQARRRNARRRRLLTLGLSVAAHGLALFVLVGAQPEPPKLYEAPEPLVVQLVRPMPPPEPPKPPAPKTSPKPPAAGKPAPPKPVPPKRIAARPARVRPPPEVQVIAAGKPSTTHGDADVSDAELAGAATAGSGGGGGRGCNMVRWLETRLRSDRRVQDAMAEVDVGKAIRVWNGQWVRHGVQEGAGLAAVRESIMWEVAFAPEACRDEPVRGLVLLSLNDQGGHRIVLGSGAWRWSDLLGRRSGARSLE